MVEKRGGENDAEGLSDAVIQIQTVNACRWRCWEPSAAAADDDNDGGGGGVGGSGGRAAKMSTGCLTGCLRAGPHTGVQSSVPGP